MKLILTESDLSTITNALRVARDSCSSAAEHSALDSVDAEAFKESAEKYDKLCLRIEVADAIEVQL